MNKVVKAFLSFGGVVALGLAFSVMGWGLFKGMALGALCWLVFVIVNRAKGVN